VLRSVGINPLLVYIFAELLRPVLDSLVFHNDPTDTVFHYIYNDGFARLTNDEVAHLLWALTVVICTVLLAVTLRLNNVLFTL